MKKQKQQSPKQNKISLLFTAVAIILAVVCFFVLPDQVITQISFGGSGANSMPKLSAIALPFALGAGGAVFSFDAKGDEKKWRRCLYISAVGIVVFAITLAVNLAG